MSMHHFHFCFHKFQICKSKKEKRKPSRLWAPWVIFVRTSLVSRSFLVNSRCSKMRWNGWLQVRGNTAWSQEEGRGQVAQDLKLGGGELAAPQVCEGTHGTWRMRERRWQTYAHLWAGVGHHLSTNLMAHPCEDSLLILSMDKVATIWNLNVGFKTVNLEMPLLTSRVSLQHEKWTELDIDNNVSLLGKSNRLFLSWVPDGTRLHTPLSTQSI